MTTPRRSVSARARIATLLIALAACSAPPVGPTPAPGSSTEDREAPDDDSGLDDCAGASCAAVPGYGSRCGNGRVERGEQCDDGRNNGPGRRCTAACKLNVCGDGDTRIGVEQCDGGTGAPRDTATCDADCTLPVCGDGHVNPVAGEQCDFGAGNGAPGSACNQRCQFVACGNGLVEPGEQCDDGNAANGDDQRCTAACQLNVCGDGHLLIGGEQCDSGTGSDTATCDADCTLPVCGDGYLNLAAGEQCDDGNATNGDGCSAACRLE